MTSYLEQLDADRFPPHWQGTHSDEIVRFTWELMCIRTIGTAVLETKALALEIQTEATIEANRRALEKLVKMLENARAQLMASFEAWRPQGLPN